MKPMGTIPRLNKETDELKRKIWAEQYNQRNKPQMPQTVIDDQMGVAAIDQEPYYFECCECGEPYQMGKAFIGDGSLNRFWCESCFREMAWTKYGLK